MAKKRSGTKASTIAGRVLAQLEGEAASTKMWTWNEATLTVGDVRTLAASVLSQDETKGQAKKSRRKK